MCEKISAQDFNSGKMPLSVIESVSGKDLIAYKNFTFSKDSKQKNVNIF
jgi:hypothetical protein